MRLFLYEVVARIVAIYLCFYFGRQLRDGFVERKIEFYLTRSDFIDWLLTSPSSWIVYRDIAPVRYWMTIGLRIFGLLACLAVAIFGWLQPNT